MEVQDIFEDFQDPGPIPAEGYNAYKVAIRNLDFYFRVEENIPYERHVFCQLSLQEGETADQFMAQSGNYATGGKPDQPRRDFDRPQSYDANFVGDQNASDSEENCAFPFAVTENQGETCNATRLKEPVLKLNINGITTRVLIDSGSVSNLIGMEEYEELKAQGLNAKMEDCHKLLYAYGGRELESGRCLLGHETSQALGLLRNSSSVSSEFVECNVVGENLALVLQAKYPTVFVGVGKLKDYKLKLHKCRYDDEHVRMVALKAVPVAIKIQEIESASAEDEELQAVHNCLVSGNWEKGARSFLMVRTELTFIGKVILRVTRVVIPKVLR
ncbi:uncharacterized protein LOC111345868 [Stylophora pistillata]|uniref:uncharacterized protein LOC111345868 n=1 Tax=Stylophora pistillata TaxID=50429 RepID=UPI000C03D1A4|nr:uncharacterized protein LOC111345868 [Stylophora pistillata]